MENVAQSAAADTKWTAVYVGDAHAGDLRRRSNIQAKAALALASDGQSLYLALYFCGTGTTLSTSTHWLKGHVPLPASGNLAELGAVDLATTDGWSAHVNMTGPGTVTRDDGVTLNWVASYVGDGSSAGLYRYVYGAESDTAGGPLAGAIAGVIQWNGGSQGAVVFPDAHVLQIDPLSPSKQAYTFANAPAPIPVTPVDTVALAQ